LGGTAAQKDLVRNTTSQLNSDSETRTNAASTAWNLSLDRITTVNEHLAITPMGILRQFAYALNGGYTVTMTYADGGKEQFKYIIGIPALIPVPNTLVPGTGTSNCPS